MKSPAPFTVGAGVAIFAALATAQDLTVTKVAGAPSLADPSVILRQTNQDNGGNTRFRYYPANAPERTGLPTRFDVNADAWRYSLRDRDLGQSFTVPTDLEGTHYFQAVTLRVGPTAQANEGAAGGAAVSMQLFEIGGTAVVDFNGTTGSQPARWDTFAPNQAFTDDFINGLTFTSLGVYSGGVLPADITTGEYMRWTLTNPILLESGKQYAFMVMFDDPADSRGLALANWNRATSGNLGPNDGAWSFRRCGSSSDFDDVFVFDRDDPAEVETARSSASLPADMTTRSQITPSTVGYPDVDTYRDFVYFIHTVSDPDEEPGDPDPEPVPPEPTEGVSVDFDPPAGPYEAVSATDNGTTSVRWRPNGDETDLGAVFTNGPATRQLRSLTVRIGTANLGSEVPGLPVILDFMKVTGPLNSPTFVPLWRVETHFPDDLLGDNFVTFHLLSQNQILESNTAYAFLIGSGREEPGPTDSDRFRLYTQNSDTVAGTYEIRREFEFGTTRPGVEEPPNVLNTGREFYFFINGADIDPWITGSARAPGLFSVNVPSLNGGIYQLQRSPDLMPPWEPVMDLPGNGGLLELTDNDPPEPPADPRYFYRVEVGP